MNNTPLLSSWIIFVLIRSHTIPCTAYGENTCIHNRVHQNVMPPCWDRNQPWAESREPRAERHKLSYNGVKNRKEPFIEEPFLLSGTKERWHAAHVIGMIFTTSSSWVTVSPSRPSCFPTFIHIIQYTRTHTNPPPLPLISFFGQEGEIERERERTHTPPCHPMKSFHMLCPLKSFN